MGHLSRVFLSNLYHEDENEQEIVVKSSYQKNVEFEIRFAGCFVPMKPCTPPFTQVHWLLRYIVICNIRLAG